jgi:hypothetical protein
MTPKPKLEVLPPLPREYDPSALDAFHEDRVRRDLARFAGEPGLFGQYAERLRVRFQKAGEKAILEHWISFYETGNRLVAAKAGMERSKSEYLQLAREHEIHETEKTVSLTKLQADIEEQNLRRDKAAYQRQHIEKFVEGGTYLPANENERKLNESFERRKMDARWEVHESLRPLHTLIELQHWRRQQRDRILDDRSLTSQEQSEDLQFVDDLYGQKRAELKVDTRIFEESV